MEPRERLPMGEQQEEDFVLGGLRQHGGSLSYTKCNNRRELCEFFWLCKRDFPRLLDAIKRLIDKGVLEREEVLVRPKQSYGGYTNPASRRVTLRITPEPVATRPLEPHAYFVS